MESTNGFYYQRRGECYLRKRDGDSAISDLKKALSFVANKKPVISLLQDALFEHGKLDEFMKGVIINLLHIRQYGVRYLSV